MPSSPASVSLSFDSPCNSPYLRPFRLCVHIARSMTSSAPCNVGVHKHLLCALEWCNRLCVTHGHFAPCTSIKADKRFATKLLRFMLIIGSHVLNVECMFMHSVGTKQCSICSAAALDALLSIRVNCAVPLAIASSHPAVIKYFQFAPSTSHEATAPPATPERRPSSGATEFYHVRRILEQHVQQVSLLSQPSAPIPAVERRHENVQLAVHLAVA